MCVNWNKPNVCCAKLWTSICMKLATCNQQWVTFHSWLLHFEHCTVINWDLTSQRAAQCRQEVKPSITNLWIWSHPRSAWWHQVEATHNDIKDTPNSEVCLEITSVFAIEQVGPFDPASHVISVINKIAAMLQCMYRVPWASFSWSFLSPPAPPPSGSLLCQCNYWWDV